MLQNKYIRLAMVAGLVVLADQITKALILKHLPLHKSIPVIAGIFDITHILNPGGAFGLMANMSVVVRTVVFHSQSGRGLRPDGQYERGRAHGCFSLYFFSGRRLDFIFLHQDPPRACVSCSRFCLDFRRGDRKSDRQNPIRNGGGFPRFLHRQISLACL